VDGSMMTDGFFNDVPSTFFGDVYGGGMPASCFQVSF
jgi:hypothetical protein